MADTPLHGVGVLVTRPRAQAAELMAAVQSKGGTAISFPVIEIVPRDASAIATDARDLPKPDIALFVSRNAVYHGLAYAEGAIKGATGPTTAAAIESAGQTVEIKPLQGYDSESLLAEPALQDVAGKQVLILRGGDGRELLATTLTERGANVNYLSFYERRLPDSSRQSLAGIEAAWRDGKINAVTIMSVETLTNLIALLSDWCFQQLEVVPLVTPSTRVIKELLARFPTSRPILAAGPQADDMVDAIIGIHSSNSGKAP
ncbi:MAG: uroporphyrinogen-III synthase [Woeseiaceae bacterium]|nr:uroporphyrinogen-III synthase [Woeseiaceae bacterium]